MQYSVVIVISNYLSDSVDYLSNLHWIVSFDKRNRAKKNVLKHVSKIFDSRLPAQINPRVI